MTKTIHIKIPLILAVGITAVFLLIACNPTEAPPTDGPELVLETELPTQEIIEDPTTISPQNTQTGGDQAPYPESNAQEPSPPDAPTPADPEPGVDEGQPAVKTELEATDPATVNLVSGQSQLVKFFAFW